MDKEEADAYRLKVRQEEEAKVQAKRDEALKKRIRQEEADRAQNGSGLMRLAKKGLKTGVDLLKDSTK